MTRAPGGARRRDERGAVTAEAALVLPLLVALTAALCWLLGVGAAQVRTVDAAREAARVVARGEDEGTATALAQRIAPEGAVVAISAGEVEVRVRVTAQVDGPGGLLGALPGATVDSTAVAAPEPGAAP